MFAHALLRPGICLLRLLILAAAPGALAGDGDLDYLDNTALTRQLRDLSKSFGEVVRIEPIAETAEKAPIWRIELGSGSAEARVQRPAMLVVAGIEGDDLAGTASAMYWAETLAAGYSKNEAIRRLLDSTTIHIWPRLNPEGAQHFFATPRLESAANSRPVDDDRDGFLDEDGPEDLDGDGLITWMRVEDPEGEYQPDPAEPRLMLKADRVKGERGGWQYLIEGIDNDRDRAWNEDGSGGVNFNRNFPYNYRFFAPDAGRHQISETETRALADFMVSHPEIGLVFTFGANDTLAQTPKAEAPKRPPTALHEDDLGWYRELGKAWREGLGLKKEIPADAQPGTFTEWIYFHRGRFSLAARPWSPAIQVELASAAPGEAKSGSGEEKKEESPSKEAEKEKPAKQSAQKPDADKRGEEDRAFLKWVDAEAPACFIPWKPFDHPDFPGQKVEIGGFAPFAKTLPPGRFPAKLADRHATFLTTLGGMLPRVAIHKLTAKHLGDGVYDLTVQVQNLGRLPTALAQGDLSREVQASRVILSVDEKSLLSGRRTNFLKGIPPGGIREVRWIVHAPEERPVEVEVISAIAGRARATVTLKKETL